MKTSRSSFLRILIVLALTVYLLSGVAFAKEEIRFGYVNWPGVTVKTHVAKEILEYLGYETDMKMLSVPLVFKGLVTKDLDLFMGAWLPTMMSIVDKYFQNGSIVSVAVNLDETIYTLAVPKYAWDAAMRKGERLIYIVRRGSG